LCRRLDRPSSPILISDWCVVTRLCYHGRVFEDFWRRLGRFCKRAQLDPN
jgi:hypothetical protein